MHHIMRGQVDQLTQPVLDLSIELSAHMLSSRMSMSRSSGTAATLEALENRRSARTISP